MGLLLRVYLPLFFLTALSTVDLGAVDVFSRGSGFWSSPGTWELDRVPQEGDRVVIVEGHEVTVPLGYQTPEMRSITVAEGAILRIVSGNFVLKSGSPVWCNGDLYIHNGIVLETDLYVRSNMYWRGGDIQSQSSSNRIVNQGRIWGQGRNGTFSASYQSDGENTSFSIGEDGRNFTFTGDYFWLTDSRFEAGRGTDVTFTNLTISGDTEYEVEGTTFFTGRMYTIQPDAQFGLGKGRLVVKAHPINVTIRGGGPGGSGGSINFPEMVVEEGTDLTIGGAHIGPATHLYLQDSVTAALTGLTNKGTIHLQGTTLMKRGGLVNEGTLHVGGDLVRENDSSYDGPWSIENLGRIAFSLGDSLTFGGRLTNKAGGVLQIPTGAHVNLAMPHTDNQEGSKVEVSANASLTVAHSFQNYGELAIAGQLVIPEGASISQRTPGKISGTGTLNVLNSFGGSGQVEPNTIIGEEGDLSIFRTNGNEPACLTFANNLTLNGVLRIHADGTEPCTDHGQVSVAGTAYVSGSTSVDSYFGSAIDEGAILTILKAGRLEGELQLSRTYRKWILANNYPNPHQISLVNGEPLTLVCPEDITLTSSAGTCVRALDFPDIEVRGGNGTATVSFDYAEDYAFPVGRTEVTATASLGGVSTSCTFRVIVTDEEAPTLTCPGNLTVSLDPCGTYQLDPEGLGITATDNCGAATVRVDRTDFDAPGTYPIDVTATDAAGNERSCAFTLTLEESDDPYTIDMTDDNLGTVCSEEEVIIRPADLLANDKLIVAGELEVLSVSVGATADGTVTANDDGTYTFVSAPDYTDYITLTYEVGVVEGSGPCTIAPSSGTIYLDVVDVVADFTFEPSSTEPGELIYGFDDISEPEATAWRYTVNGTQIGTATYAQYRFSAPGTYTVCLRVTTDCGQEEVCKDITVGGAPGPDCDAVDFGGGWNFISFDVRPPGQGLVSQVVAGSSEAGSLFLIQRRTEDGRIETYLPNYPEYGTDFPLTPGAAYRMYAFGGGTLEVCGRAVDEDIRIGIEPGYNWVGYVPQESRPAADYFGDIPGLYFARERRGSLTDFAVRYYLPNYSYFSRLSVVENGVGYEVYSFGAAEPGGWRPAGGGLSEVHTTFAGDVSGLQAGDTIAITDANGKHYAYWQVEAGGRLRAMTIFGHDTLSGAFAELPPGRELYFRWGDRQANESVTFGGEGGLEWVDLHFPNVANSLPPTEAELRTHPNPFRDRITATLRLPEAHQGAHLQLYDLNGRLLREQNLPPAAAEATYSVEWPAGDLASGTYFLRCVVGERTVVTRRVQKFR